MKLLSSGLASAFACILALGAGCKTDSNAPAAGSAQTTAPDTTAHPPGRSGRIDMPRVRPKLNEDGTSTDDKQQAETDRSQRRSDRLKEWDADGDGKLSDEERGAMHKARLENMHARFDHDGDGKLTPAELSTTRWFHGDATAADADGNGDISPEELQKAFDASRGGIRAGGRVRPQIGEKVLP